MPDPSSSPWRPAAIHALRRTRLVARGRIAAATRRWFEGNGFTEVETAALQVSPGNEAHLHAFATQAVSIDGRPAPLYLHTSPEFACKTLLACGERAIFTFARVWRNRERGPLHHPEFTMLEWYRADAPHTAMMDDCAALLAVASQAAQTDVLTWRDRRCDPRLTPERLTVAEAFDRHAGVDLMATIAADGATDRDALAAAARSVGERVAADDSWSDLFSRLIAGRVEPNLGLGRATILHAYPAAEAALARRSPTDSRVAERFELYACGVELANAFGELTDPAEQRRRFDAEMAQMERVYGVRYPIDETFLDALGHMPEASGCAVGFDRLVMLATAARHIEEVLWSPVVDPFAAR